MSRILAVIALLAASFIGSRRAHCADIAFENEIAPLSQKYCVKCHRGDRPKDEFEMFQFKTEARIKKARAEWRKVLLVVCPKHPTVQPARDTGQKTRSRPGNLQR